MSELDKLLKEYASRPTPPPQGNLEDDVWREIRIRRETAVVAVNAPRRARAAAGRRQGPVALMEPRQ